MRRLSLSLLGFIAFSLGLLVASRLAADSFTYSFNAKGNIQAGQVVALVVGDKNTVELAPAKYPQRIYGVAVKLNEAPLSVQSPSQPILVATNGLYPVTVSSENGAIQTGDYLSMSSRDGIAAKVKGRQPYIIGQATQNFNGSSGQVLTNIIPGKNPNILEDAAVPAPLRRLGESIAGKPLTASRIYSAFIIFMLTAAMALILLWIGVRNGLISIGRNPLSRRSVLRGLAQVITASVIVLAGGLIGVYLFLKI